MSCNSVRLLVLVVINFSDLSRVCAVAGRFIYLKFPIQIQPNRNCIFTPVASGTKTSLVPSAVFFTGESPSETRKNTPRTLQHN
jgi:hypothetical protein